MNQQFPTGFGQENNQQQDPRKRTQQSTLEAIRERMPTQGMEPIQYDKNGIPITHDRPDPDAMINAAMLGREGLNQPNPANNPQRTPMTAEAFFTQPAAPFRQPPVQQPQQQPQPVRQQPAYQQPQPAYQQQQQPQQPQPLVPKYRHPVVEKLLKTFGLQKEKIYDLDLFYDGIKTTYSMSLVTEDIQTWAMTEAKSKIAEDGEQAGVVYFQLLFGCSSVLAIDYEPIYKVFSINLLPIEEAKLAANPMDISTRIRKIAALELADLMYSNLVPFGEKILEFYEEKIVANKVKSAMDLDFEETVRFVCPLDTCEHYEFLKPYTYEDGSEKVYYCKFDGSIMIKTLSSAQEKNIPLE